MPPSKSCRSCSDIKYQVLSNGVHAVAQRCPSCFQVCLKCDNTGYLFSRDEQNREVALPCECYDVDLKINLFNSAKIPAQFFDATLSNFRTKAHPSLPSALDSAKFFVRDYAKGDWRGILYMGGVGVGKTRLVCSVIRELTLKQKVPCLFQEFSSLLSSIKSQYDQGISESNLLSQITNIEVLVIDELGKGRGTDWEIGILDNIISARYAQKKTTLLTTNYTDSKATTYKDHKGLNLVEPDSITLAERVGQRIYSRLQGMCAFIAIDGPDRRIPR